MMDLFGLFSYYLIFPPDHEKTVPKDRLWCLFLAFLCKACKDVFTGHNVQRSLDVISGVSLSLKVSGVVRTTNVVRLLFISSSFSFFLSCYYYHLDVLCSVYSARQPPAFGL